MRFLVLLFAVVFDDCSTPVAGFFNFFPESDVESQLAAVEKGDYVGYAAQFGMNLTIYEAITRDAWVLQLWRVRSMDVYDEKLSAPVIVNHAAASSSFDLMWNLRNESAAFVLADNGYDVWLPNFRANQFSNAILSNGSIRPPKPDEYYRAAWQYQADFDLPAIFDKVLDETKQAKFYLIGHSLGATLSFAFLSQNHSYDDKLAHFAAVVPVLRFDEDSSPSVTLSQQFFLNFVHALQVDLPLIGAPFGFLFKLIFGRMLLSSEGSAWDEISSSIRGRVCGLLPILCELPLSLLTQRDPLQAMMRDPHLNQTRLGIYFRRAPAGATAIAAYNYAQEGKKSPWTKIDFRNLPLVGLTNEGEYNSTEPPAYDFGALGVPFSLFYVKNDVFTGVETAKKVIAQLNATDYKFIDGNNLSHVDAVLGFDVRCYTINDIMSKLQDLEGRRGNDTRTYRSRVASFVRSLPFSDGCRDRTT